MYRRRRRARSEIEFGFDSFLDLVANVVGIILRLILVAWVGARTYKAIVPPLPSPPPALAEPTPLPEPTDFRVPQLAARRQQIEGYRQNLKVHETRVSAHHEIALRLQADLDALAAKRNALVAKGDQLKSETATKEQTSKNYQYSVAELQKRSKSLLTQVEQLRKKPIVRKEFQYRAPLSTTVQGEELMFELRHNRVTLIDTGALLDYVRRDLRRQSDALRSKWEASATTDSVGAFRLRYTLERERSVMDVPGVAPGDGNYRIAVTGWEVIPVTENRGETMEQALQDKSVYRRLTDTLDPRQTVITFWVYPDSFALYRKLRNQLHDRKIVVAGRPLPEGVAIASSRQGTRSRGQ